MTLLVIYGQSLLSRTDSGNASSFVVTWLKPFLDPRELWTEDVFHHFVRKAGHFTEYACFGFFFGRFSMLLGQLRGVRYVSMPLFVALIVAVSDEYLQYFTGRGSAVTDVVLDFAGAMFGFFVIYLLHIRRDSHETGLQ